MKIIGIDSSGLVASVAVWCDDVITAEYTTNYKKTHSQTLLPMLDEIKKMTELDLDTVDAIAIASGPGSYTGLRIGSATAKGIALVIDKPIVEVPTLEGLAYNLWGTNALICPLMDARRKQVYTGLYEFTPEFNIVLDGAAIPISEIADKINELGREVIFLGDGVPVYSDFLDEAIKVPFKKAPAHRLFQSAASVATLGAYYYHLGKTVDADDHAPTYLRKSQAENEGPKHFEV